VSGWIRHDKEENEATHSQPQSYHFPPLSMPRTNDNDRHERLALSHVIGQNGSLLVGFFYGMRRDYLAIARQTINFTKR
jgi:hypothetical protein